MAAADEEVKTDEPEVQAKKPESWEGTVSGKYNWDDTANKKDADADVQGEAISKYAWSDGKKAVSIYIELEGLDDVKEDQLSSTNGETDVTFTIAAIGGKKRVFTMANLSNEIDGVKIVQKPGKNTVVRNFKRSEFSLWQTCPTRLMV